MTTDTMVQSPAIVNNPLEQQPDDTLSNLAQQSQKVTYCRHYEQTIRNSNLTQLHSIIIISGFNIGMNQSAELAFRLSLPDYPRINFNRAYLDGVNVVFVVNPETLKEQF